MSRLDRSGARWQHMDADTFAAYVEEAVTDLGDGPADFDAMTRQLQAEPRGHHPVRILAGGGFVAMKVAHAYGDAGPVNTLLRELIRAAGEERAAQIAAAATAPDGAARGVVAAVRQVAGPVARRAGDVPDAALRAGDHRPWSAALTVRDRPLRRRARQDADVARRLRPGRHHLGDHVRGVHGGAARARPATRTRPAPRSSPTRAGTWAKACRSTATSASGRTCGRPA